MRSSEAIVATVLGRSLVSIACCFVVGLIVFQSRVFHPYFWTSQLIMFGIAGSLFFHTLRINRRNAFAVLLVVFVVTIGLLFRHLQPVMILRDSIFYATLAGVLYAFFTVFYVKSVRLRNLQPLVLATLFAIAFSIATVFLGFLDETFFRPVASSLFEAVLTNAKYQFLVGLGIGLGILLLDIGYVHRACVLIQRLLGSLGASFREFGERL
ncbi:MAG: hypothetical protein NTU47_12060 [Ignavibacteriales bacterium]|nr:hypothetical protein [Ignavibacteriales bacterium]